MIHVICYESPEWSIPVKAYTRLQRAEEECKRMNNDPKEKKGRIFAELSRFVVSKPITLDK